MRSIVPTADFDPESDVDVLITLDNGAPWSRYDWVDMIEELKWMSGRYLDLVEKTASSIPFRRRRILSNCRIISAAQLRS